MSSTSPPDAAFLAPLASKAEILALFAQAPNWQEKYRQLMLLGKRFPALANEFRVEAAQVRGCESNAWLYHRQLAGKHYFLADSDARIVKGLIGLLLAANQGLSAAEIAAFDADAYFNTLGLSGQLSPSRTNGLYALAGAIKACAAEG
ncbi:SufE family protein [Shewanella sp. AS16]|uniref:SufE family protein n=1 Tax=Shewanella sp. AS16 TaxID=2907625 RepID=UPI001F17F84A|nr:SufE family protein [Shewanella sp. AS16]MCE9685657.1 SufE family protein [Shewanella sp. AS16]